MSGEQMPDGRTAVLGILGPGEIFGEISFVQGGGATASVIADSNAEVYVIEGHRHLAADEGAARHRRPLHPVHRDRARQAPPSP